MRFLSKLILVLLALTGIPRPLQATGSWDVGPTPLDIMQKAGVPANVDAISEILVDAAREEQFRFWAALALGQLGDDGAIPVLLSSLSDQIVLVRLGAATALGYIPSEKSTQPLCKTALHDHDPAPRHGAVTSLSAVMTDATTQCLVRVAVNEQETTKVRLLSLNLLEQHVRLQTNGTGVAIF